MTVIKCGNHCPMADLWQDQILMAIPSINGGTLLARMLPTLRFKPSNVVVLDQGSIDETAVVCAGAGVEVIQLGHSHTYTEACNIGARIARDRDHKYLCVANNDIVFRTDVLAELLAEMERIPNSASSHRPRSSWTIHSTANRSPIVSPGTWRQSISCMISRPSTAPRNASNPTFRELTCALVRMSAIDEIGFLDNEYGFYHRGRRFWL